VFGTVDFKILVIKKWGSEKKQQKKTQVKKKTIRKKEK